MINTQPAEGLDRQEDTVEIHSMWKTIQGEGPFIGYPAVFVRMSGCNISCPGCDTEYTSKRERMSHEQAINTAYVMASHSQSSLVVLTGGEPFRQNIRPLVHGLLDAGLNVQIETNGLLYQNLINARNLHIVCSPKGANIHPQLQTSHELTYKYVLQRGFVDPDDGLPTSILGNGIRPARPWIVGTWDKHPTWFRANRIIVNPLDEGDPVKNRCNLEVCVESSLKYGYRLGIQLHKLVGLE